MLMGATADTWECVSCFEVLKSLGYAGVDRCYQ